ncbi:MAG: biotin carboxylase [Lewinellaceae bacterium]|nr:hypothetical protein [Saprospiraceae bacterium]MCB9340061.1 biotin carboxylase [Lewinellaceae bacterium]
MEQLRALLLNNTTPIYFIDWCVFTALGMEEYIGNFQYICATDTFDGRHPNVFVPKSYHYDHSLSSKEILNSLLRNEEVRAHIKSRGKGKVLLWLLDEETERLAAELDLEICLPPVAVRRHWDNKANTNRLAEKAGVPCVPYVLSTVKDYAHLRAISGHLGERLVVQSPHGMSGMTTYFISDETDFEKHRSAITNGDEMKIMRRINCRSAGLEACITRRGVAVTPLLVELVGCPEIAVYKGGWCGNEFFPNAFADYIIQQARDYTVKMGEQLRQVGYTGYFEPDYLVDLDDGTLYLGEMNLRFSGFTPLINNTNQAHEDIPLLLLHLAEWLDIEYELDIEALNDKWIDQANLSPLSFLHCKNVDTTPAIPIPTGIYAMDPDGNLVFLRPATNPKSLGESHEIFWLSTAGKEARVERGNEFGALFIRERVTADGQHLTEKAKAWVAAVKRYAVEMEAVAT